MTKEYIFNVQTSFSGKRLDVFLSCQEAFFSRALVQNLIKNEQVFVNGRIEKSSYKVITGDAVKVLKMEDEDLIIKPENIPLDIVYEDDDILAVNKPKNMLTHPAAKEVSGTLVNALLYRYGEKGLSDINGSMRPGIVHRLDRNTSGLLLIAKNNGAHEFLTRQIKEKTALRQYLAVVRGNFEENEGIINLPISRSIKSPEKMEVNETGKPSITKYKVLEEFKGYSYIELTLLTGRTHQIRVHMSYTGHPVVNDSLYCREKFKVKTTEQVLQAYKLQFTALKDNALVNLEIKPDNDIIKVLNYLRSLRNLE